MSFYKTDQAQALGAGQLLPAGSLTDRSLADHLLSYRRVVAGGYKSITPEEVEGRLPPGPMQVSRKLDGQMWFLIIDGDEVVLSNPLGRLILGDLPVLVEARGRAGDCVGRTIFAGELYVHREEGRPRVGDVAHALAGAEGSGEEQLRFAVFDLVAGGDAEAILPLDSYPDRLEVLTRLFGEGERIHVVDTEQAKAPAGALELYTRWVETEKSEGLVVRTTGRTYKIKPTFTVDAVVVGYTERSEEPDQVRSLALAFLRGDGSFHHVGSCGNMSTDTRRELRSLLAERPADSGFRLASRDGALYRFVRPEVVVEIKATDVQSEDSTGRSIARMVLTYGEAGYQPVRKLPCASLLFPIFIRVRDDKQVDPADIPIDQVLERCLVTDTEAVTEKADLPPSEVLRREVYVSETKKGKAVRKLVMWKTNKEQADLRFPAYVVHFTDYSGARKSPLNREVRLAPTREAADGLADDMIKANIKRGWKLVE